MAYLCLENSSGISCRRLAAGVAFVVENYICSVTTPTPQQKEEQRMKLFTITKGVTLTAPFLITKIKNDVQTFTAEPDPYFATHAIVENVHASLSSFRTILNLDGLGPTELSLT